MTKQEIIDALRRLRDVKSEVDRDAKIRELRELAPHAYLSDLVYYCERDRTDEEIADEALLRERIWVEREEDALRDHIEAQILSTLADKSIPETNYKKISAQLLLNGLKKSRSAH